MYFRAILNSGEVRVPGVVPLNGTVDLQVCADSFTEFLYRYWVENELHFALADGRPLAGPLASYAAHPRITFRVAIDGVHDHLED